MPLWGRHELTALILRQWHQQIHRLRGRVDVHLVTIGSEGRASALLTSGYSDTMSYVEAPNDPLNRKWNAALSVARAWDPDAVLIVGSDDLLSDGLLLACAEKVRAGVPYFGLRDLYFFDAATLRLGYWPGYGTKRQPLRTGEPVGCARCHSLDVMERVGWQLWPSDPAQNTVLDLMSLRYLLSHGVQPSVFSLAELGGKAVDIKVGQSITGFKRIPYQRIERGAAALAYLADLVDEAGLQQLQTQWRAAA